MSATAASAAAGPDSEARLRIDLRNANAAAAEQPPSKQASSMRSAADAHSIADSSLFAKLDGSIKKNTSFIKKIKAGITAAQLPTLKKELSGLKIEKYIEEIATSIAADAPPSKAAADVYATVEIVSLVHQRHPDFSPTLVENILKTLGPPPAPSSSQTSEQREREESTRIARQRSSLRLLTELYLVGIAVDPPKTKGGLIPNVLLDMLGKDKTNSNLPIAVSFAKYFGDFFLDRRQVATSKPSKNPDESQNDNSNTEKPQDAPQQEYTPAIPDDLLNQLVPPAIRRAATQLFDVYYNRISDQLLREHRRLHRIEKVNSDIFVARGEIVEERQDNYEKLAKLYEKLRVSTETLSNCLHLQMPELPNQDSVTRMSSSIGITDGRSSFTGRESKSGIWEDEDMMTFYESILDLQNQVPTILLGPRVKPQSVAEPSSSTDPDGVVVTDIVDADADPSTEFEKIADPDQHDDSPVSDSNASPNEKEPAADPDPEDKFEVATSKAALDSIFARLPNALNRESIDKIAIDFAFQNNRSARRKLTQTLLAVPRQRQDLLPYYARLVATLIPYMSDIGTTIVEELDSSFRYHQRKKEQVFIEEKTKNIRFIGELTKFRVVPSYTVFHCLKVLIDDLTHQNVELVCALLETCGRFLFRNPETNVRMANFIEILQRKKNVQNLDHRFALMIESAIYDCNPPDTPVTAHKPREPVVMFLRKLVYNDLERATSDKVLRFMLMADWNDPLVRRTLEKLFIKIWKVKYSTIVSMARILADIGRSHPDFVVMVVDAILEEIRAGLESNIFKHNQRRIAVVRYLGELFNAHIIGIGIVFDTLYLLLRFGYPGGIPRPGLICPFDIPTDFFRLRLVCTLLDAYYHGASRRRIKGPTAKSMSSHMLNNYLAFMQVYLYTKAPMPMEVEFFLLETLESVKPDFQLAGSFEAALARFYEATEVERKLVEAAAVAASETAEASVSMNVVEHVNQGVDDPESGMVDGEFSQDGSYGQVSIDMDDDDSDSDSDSDVNSDDNSEKDFNQDDDDDDQEAVVYMSEEDPIEEDPEFEREFNRMMQESFESRRNERKNVIFDAPVPMRRGTATTTESREEDLSPSATLTPASENGHVTFTLLTKRGNKQQQHAMALPSDSLFAMSTLSMQRAEQQEKIQLKELVLSYEERSVRGPVDAENNSEFPSLQTSRDRLSVPHAGGHESGGSYRGRRGNRRGKVIWTNSSG